MARNKILYIAPSVGIGGVETFLKHVSQGHSGDCEPLFLLFQKGPLGQWLEAQDSTVFYCQHRPRLSRPWTWLLFQVELFRLVRNHKINIVHASLSYAALFSWMSYFFSKFVWFQHGPVSGWIDRLAYALPHHAVVYNSQHTLNQQMIVNGSTQPLKNDYLLYLGTPSVDIDQRDSFRQQFITHNKLASDTLIITMACRLQRWKGVHIAINAIEKLQRKTKKPFVFYIFGDSSWDSAYTQELQNMITGLPINICAPVEDLTSIYLATDFVLNCSTTPEPFGLTVIEALSAGAVPIAARLGGPLEILTPELTHCLFEPENSEDLSTILLSFMEDISTLQKYKAKSFDLFEQKFTVDTMIGNLESIYQKVLNS